MFYGPFGPRSQILHMIQIGSYKYKLVLFDTNAISFIIKNKAQLQKLFDTYPFPEYIYAYSPYVVYELGQNKEIFNKYLDLFSSFPSLLLQNERQLFEEMETSQKSIENMNIWSVNPSMIFGETTSRELMEKMFSLADIEKKFKVIYERFSREYEIMLEWAEWGKSYNPNSKMKWIENRLIEAFSCNIAGFFLENSNCKGEPKQYINNKIIQVISNAWFYKFVADRNRKTSINDIVDIYNASALPFCDVFISERNMNNVIKSIITKKIVKDIIIENACDYLLREA